MTYEHINWDLSEVVDPKYIAAVRTLIDDNYPRREPKSSKSPYPTEHLGSEIRSDEEAISTAARVKVLKLLYSFDIDSVAAAFSAYNKGFLLSQSEFVEDLIPGSFIKHATEKGGTPHNDLFTRNSTIQSMFRMQPLYGAIDFDAGLSTLLHNYQSETMQILLSSSFEIDRIDRL
ncbi:hypothetical protein FOTG_18603 [Fusarium oxysporum f. sp. vasinfectum 25433]|uniref:Uncharacterized protein n=1 Tax=Fusarium oxysporum f. sp. vasinfectum 25433 TaxID=1089449 RepID=X0KH39_FUSOX|nr:hypothetical protein FOTG_18603 [Fusarium oxysporum f. sp. vasinfectum 25433]